MTLIYPYDRIAIRMQFARFLIFVSGFFTANQALYAQGINGTTTSKTNVTVSGFVQDETSGEMLGGVNVAVFPNNIVTTTNRYGFYSITIPRNNQSSYVSVVANYPSFQIDSLKWWATKDTFVNFRLIQNQRDIERIDTVNIKVRKTIADKVEMSRIEIPVNQIKEIPALLGEKDVLKVIQLLPGVQKGSEGQSGIYVRGGGPDQNLLILDEAVVYNASHLFGFFSVFNGDALKSVELVKGGFPARYGGRLSSVIDLSMKEGNNQRTTGEVGIGLISSRFLVEGPLKKGKSSFMLSGRRTYIDVLMQPIIMAQSGGNTGGYFFYDFNAKANYILSDKDKVYVSGYFGQDKFYTGVKERNSRFDSDFGWGNRTLTARWNHLFNPKLFVNTSLIYSHYNLSIGVENYAPADTFLLKYSSLIDDYGVKSDFDWRPLPGHMVRFGFSTIMHQFRPGAVVVKFGQTNALDRAIQTITNYESGVYIEDQWRINKKFTIYPGFRVSHYVVGKKQYVFPEPRFSGSYNLRKDLSFKASYAMMNQYIHLLSNSGISLPTDLWVPATENIKPMRSQQVAAGLAKDFKKGFSLSLEGYYKTMSNMIQYKDGASFFLDEDLFDPQAPTDSRSWENKVTSGRGWSYGAELFLQKQMGKLTGWVGYTLSWTQLQFDELNGGKVFNAKYDRRHDLSVVSIYKISKYLTVSGTWVYGTGNAITAPQGIIPATGHQMSKLPFIWSPEVQFPGSYIDYGARNSFRMEAYHRLDFGIQFSKPKKLGVQTWEFSVYNAYNRANPFFYYGGYDWDGPNPNELKLKKISLFPIIPSITYSFKFK